MDSKELQSRRDFFKSAAKKALPIVGAIAVSQMPFVSHAHEKDTQSTWCSGCYGGCNSGCYTGCRGACTGSCEGGCQQSCDGSCTGDCSGSCSGGSSH
ncbi:MAG: Cys-Xaa-Xaa-Xaa repeat radical SAM target protein [Prevotella sp.]|nr:Cys-Xaa-Xaa-Xaa repeat radical SAM target protein [Prevotella sp.]